jgi:hypothetical protein
MLPPGIPGQIADGAMILMPVGAVMGENQVRTDFLISNGERCYLCRNHPSQAWLADVALQPCLLQRRALLHPD